MFSFFKRTEVIIHSITIPDLGWELSKKEPSMIQWHDPQNPNILSLNFFNLPPDIPTVKDINALRTFYRNLVSGVNGAILQVDVSQTKNINFLKTLVKLPQKPSGISYIMSLTFPFKNCSFVIKLTAAEKGHTGAREAIAANEFLGRTTKLLQTGPRSYDSTIKLGALMNHSEKELFDDKFPNHHLTKARRLISQLEKEIKFRREISSLQPFDK